MLISLVEFAQRHDRDPATARQMAGRGGFQTARKIGRNWVIDSEEAWPDRRVTSGKYRKEKDKMKKFFEVNGIEYEIKAVTAICAADEEDESKRQGALMVSSEQNGERSEYVVFGWEMPESEEDFTEMCEDYSAWESAQEVLASVK